MSYQGKLTSRDKWLARVRNEKGSSTQRPGVAVSTATESGGAIRLPATAARHDRGAPSPRPIVVSPKAARVRDYLRVWADVRLEGLARLFTGDDLEVAELLCREAGVQTFTRAGARWCAGRMSRLSKPGARIEKFD